MRRVSSTAILVFFFFGARFIFDSILESFAMVLRGIFSALAQEDVQAIKNTIDQLGNAVIEKITEVLSQIDAGTLDITSNFFFQFLSELDFQHNIVPGKNNCLHDTVEEKLQEFEDALDRVGEGGDHVLVEVSAVFYRYILYGGYHSSQKKTPFLFVTFIFWLHTVSGLY